MIRHVTVNLEWILRQPDCKITGMLRDESGHVLTPNECRNLAIQKLREGFDVLPICDNHDQRGYCLGHDY
jgi:hypothetical protein